MFMDGLIRVLYVYISTRMKKEEYLWYQIKDLYNKRMKNNISRDEFSRYCVSSIL